MVLEPLSSQLVSWHNKECDEVDCNVPSENQQLNDGKGSKEIVADIGVEIADGREDAESNTDRVLTNQTREISDVSNQSGERKQSPVVVAIDAVSDDDKSTDILATEADIGPVPEAGYQEPFTSDITIHNDTANVVSDVIEQAEGIDKVKLHLETFLKVAECRLFLGNAASS